MRASALFEHVFQEYEKTTPKPVDTPPAAALMRTASGSFLDTLAQITLPGESIGVTYARAIQEQLEYTLTVVPRTSDGANSHHIEQVQLWADSVYVIPPFLTSAGVLQNNKTLLTEAYMQVSTAFHLLVLWKHILLGGNDQDHGFWSTGNGWAAAGALRVLSAIACPQYAEMGYIRICLQDLDSYLFHNYANDSSTFLDVSSTVLLTSTVYRLALIGPVYKHLPLAEKCREALSANGQYSPASTTSSAYSSYAVPSPTSQLVSAGLLHFSPQMWLEPVVDSYDWYLQGGSSPEGQAFVVEMYAPWRDWVEAGAVNV
ncbi:hypothetical protein WOLCODRAFT_106156 [Wolfiporia cocos MD-104 SS10]|uniref:Uncharacterized protein n=1 Tax=Wolfiporia cocos (strain MD-104) TaxID=742152 RepID=A0A2H3IX54_WOLCO|nr:hypothetical protein WOLCODRAFT_106156 [Wolfiporia cocos MD-104 SS10]